MPSNLVAAEDPRVPGIRLKPLDQALAELPYVWGRLKSGPITGRSDLRKAIVDAERYLDMPDVLAAVRDAIRIASEKEIERFLLALMSAWKLFPTDDLAGFGLQLRLEVEARRPTVHALGEALHRLRVTCPRLPSIAEVIAAIDTVDRGTRAIASTIDRIPAALAEAKAHLTDQAAHDAPGRE